MIFYKKILIFAAIAVLFLFVLMSGGCQGSDYINVNFETDGGTAVEGMRIRFNEFLNIRDKTSTKEYYVFDGWYNDKECTIPYSRNDFEKDILVYAKWLPMFELMPDDTYCLANGYKNGYTKFDIPKKYNGKLVTSIAPDAFYQSTLEEISIPNSVNSIGNGAFGNCENLFNLIFEEGTILEYLGEWVFGGCTSLESIILPDILYQTGYIEEAFGKNSNLKSITFAGSIDTKSMFLKDYPCHVKIEEILITSKMWEFNIDFTDTAWYKAQPDGIVYLNDIAYAIKGDVSGVISIKEGTKYIAPLFAQNKLNITEVILPSTIIGIGHDALNSRSIENINLPDNLKYIGDRAFGSYKKFTSIPDTVEHIGSSAFSGCTQLTALPSSLVTVKSSAFRDCTGISTLPTSLVSVGHEAFDGASNITAIPDNLQEIGLRSFDNTAWYEMQEDGVLYYGKTAFSYKGDRKELKEVTIKEGTEVIGENLFGDFINLSKITLPKSVRVIGAGALSGTGLITVSLPIGVQEIGDGAFSYNSWLTDINIPGTVKRIGNFAFNYCIKLEQIKLREGLKHIGDYAFNNTLITSMFIPKTVTYLGEYVFTKEFESLRMGYQYLPTAWYRNNDLKYAEIICNQRS